MPIGVQNDLLTNLVYSSGLVDSGETEIAKSLTDQYKLVEENITLDTEVNSVYTYDFVDSINEDTKEISVIKTIAVRSKEANIIEKTLTTYTNPNIRSIGESTFYRCELLTDINFPIVTKIYNSAFSHCSKLVNVNIPLVTSIDYNAFYDCSSLVDVNFPLLTDASHDAFAFCTSLQSILAPMLTSISGGMFSSCYFLKNVTFPEVVRIYGNAFSDNTRLTEVVVSKVNTIDNTAFKNCYSLVKLFISQTDSICKLNVSAFQNCSHILGKVSSDYNPDGLKDGYIYVPASLLSQYKVAEN